MASDRSDADPGFWFGGGGGQWSFDPKGGP